MQESSYDSELVFPMSDGIWEPSQYAVCREQSCLLICESAVHSKALVPYSTSRRSVPTVAFWWTVFSAYLENGLSARA